jgi:hypothetical protein
MSAPRARSEPATILHYGSIRCRAVWSAPVFAHLRYRPRPLPGSRASHLGGTMEALDTAAVVPLRFQRSSLHQAKLSSSCAGLRPPPARGPRALAGLPPAPARVPDLQPASGRLRRTVRRSSRPSARVGERPAEPCRTPAEPRRSLAGPGRVPPAPSGTSPDPADGHPDLATLAPDPAEGPSSLPMAFTGWRASRPIANERPGMSQSHQTDQGNSEWEAPICWLPEPVRRGPTGLHVAPRGLRRPQGVAARAQG